jgi:hypothetical protein
LGEVLERLVELEADVRYRELAVTGVPGIGYAMGTTKGESCPDHRHAIIYLLEEHGFQQHGDSLDRLDVDGKFTAEGLTGQETATSFAWRVLGVPSAQLELHTSLRVVERREDATPPAPFHGDSGRIRRVVRALVHLVGLLSSEETTEGRVHDA